MDEYPGKLPILTISSNYQPNKGEWKTCESYTVEEIPCCDGRGFRIIKETTGDVYDVLIHRNGQDHTCDCPGGTYTGRCKHLDALRHFVADGTISDPKEFPPEALPRFDEDFDPFATEEDVLEIARIEELARAQEVIDQEFDGLYAMAKHPPEPDWPAIHALTPDEIPF